jgi:hypothetical protein
LGGDGNSNHLALRSVRAGGGLGQHSFSANNGLKICLSDSEPTNRFLSAPVSIYLHYGFVTLWKRIGILSTLGCSLNQKSRRNCLLIESIEKVQPGMLSSNGHTLIHDIFHIRQSSRFN